jgi:RNA polymerase sigma factor (sigma-70 family)
MDPYLRRLAGIPRLDADTERDLAVRSSHGDAFARDQLITASLSLVVMRAKRLGFSGQHLLDAIQSGTVGLIEAVDRFDPARGCRLSTYAWWWIGHAMAQTLREYEQLAEFDSQAAEDTEPSVAAYVLDGLPVELAEVFACRFETVVSTGRPRPRGDVARRLGLTVSQVRTREAKAMRQVRSRLAKVGDRASHQHRGADPL